MTLIKNNLIAITVLANIAVSVYTEGILFPRESQFREVKSLDGIWDFWISEDNITDHVDLKPDNVELMPVPSSYNDITQKKEIRDHVGWVWYWRKFWVPSSWLKDKKRIFLRFGGVNYRAIAWVNGEKILEHSGGHLPFVGEIPASLLKSNKECELLVAVDNTLSIDTVPQGWINRPSGKQYPQGYFTLEYSFDFFNYAGIHRSVHLFTTPPVYIEDIDYTMEEHGDDVHLNFSVTMNPDVKPIKFAAKLYDATGKLVSSTAKGRTIICPDCKKWWPYTMVENDADAGYLYTLEIMPLNYGEPIDSYRLKVGFRTVTWDENSLMINGKPFYFRGFGRHEDFNVRGRGIDNVMIVKDHNLIKWTGANSYRTSHYPYSEEIMDLADRLGIVIIDECAAVAIDHFGATLKENHKSAMKQLIQRDKHRPSVVMWSVANEPRSNKIQAEAYFKEIFEFSRNLDNSRPFTVVMNQPWNIDLAAQFADILCINRYFSWYSDTGHLEVASNELKLDVENWISKFNKPLIVTEYGADTIAGFHMDPDFVFTEEYQYNFMLEYFKAFDYLRKNNKFIGEMIWNFADFMTKQGITRVLGNKKGIFTRERQPKLAAHLLRRRYHQLSIELNNITISDNYKNSLHSIY